MIDLNHSRNLAVHPLAGCFHVQFLLFVLIACLGLLIPTGRVTAQTFTTLHSFAGGSDGASPYAGVILSGNTLFGTTYGTVFAVNTDGTGFTNLHSFTATSGSGGVYGTNSDGINPLAGLINNLSGNTLYGTARYGGSSGNGTVFTLATDGTGFTTLHSFTASSTNSSNVDTNSEGVYPGGLLLSGNTLYGVAGYGGSTGSGTLFAINTKGTGFTNLYTFTAIVGSYPNYANSDGGRPNGLILSGSTLYGTTLYGGSWANGTVFAINIDGTGFTNLHSFSTGLGTFPYITNSDGAWPYAGLILSGSTLYGTTQYGGGSANGTVFAINTDGTGFTTLHRFTAVSGPSGSNSDGIIPTAGLTLSGTTLYGTTQYGGSSANGTVFAVNTDGTGFTPLYNFTTTSRLSGIPSTNSDGAVPSAGLVLSNNTLYGTASQGGRYGGVGRLNNGFGFGTVFSLSFTPKLTITTSHTTAFLSWPTNVAGFDYAGYHLLSTTNLGSRAFWSTVALEPVVVDGQYIVPNPISSPPQFYLLWRHNGLGAGICLSSLDCPPGYRCIIPTGATVGTCSCVASPCGPPGGF